MSTIASPRDPPRRPPLPQITPTSSTRPSLDINPSSTSSSPNPNTHAPPPNKRANRAALREYYNLKKAATPGTSTPTVEITTPSDLPSPTSTLSELDVPGFDAEGYISSTLASNSLAELLRTYARVLGEIRALDAEKKALVYDNYSKLISATETIRRMQSTMDPLNPMAGTLDLVVKGIYEQASGLREEMRREVGGKEEGEGEGGRRKRTRELAKEVLEVPGRLRRLMEEGREEEAKKEWEMPRRLLVRWKERGVGGKGVEELIEEGDGIVWSGEEGSGSGEEGSGSRSEGSGGSTT